VVAVLGTEDVATDSMAVLGNETVGLEVTAVQMPST
jgi:hypothetical protein